MSQVNESIDQVTVEDEDLESLFEMANLRQKSTGLEMVLWVSERGNTRHGPRINVSKTHSHKTNISDSVSV
jgi:hypothetical protein